ncbi:hypothetical protein Sango_0513600 [Sesamum angolense]|uniref:Retrotransposon gag domain-containing protein n=1 Tax=Sesamum angolense TaxID=2727404 RepID=A0AAE1X4P5_9LAMI|nr:hypothetical protein Sango_0513600 [Sesamum angolense]
MVSGGCVVRHDHHKLYPVHSEYVARTVNSKTGSVPYFCSARDNRKSEDEGEGGVATVSSEKVSGAPKNLRTSCRTWKCIYRRQGCRMRKRCLSRSMYLTGDAKLLWCSHLSDVANANRERIEMWEVLKKELKDQFIPCNTSWIARESLRNLKHTEKVREFVKEFNSLMLDVRDMLEEDKLTLWQVANDPEQRNDDFKARKSSIRSSRRRKKLRKCPRSQPPTLGRYRQSPVLPTVCARCQARVYTCLPACRVLLHIGHVLYQPSTSLPTSVYIHAPRAPCLSKISAHRRLLAHSPVCLSMVTTDARPSHPPAVQPVRTVARPFLNLAS